MGHQFIYIQGQFTAQTMKSHHGRWPFPWSKYLKNQFTKPFDPSLDVNQMWTERNDHASKVNVLIFRNLCPKKTIMKKGKKKQKKLCSTILLSSLPPKNHFLEKIILISLLCRGPLLSSTRAHLLPLPLQNPLDHFSGKCRP